VTQITLASGLTFPEELLLVALRQERNRKGRSKLVAKPSVKRGIVLLTMAELMLQGAIRVEGEPDPYAPQDTIFIGTDSTPDAAGYASALAPFLRQFVGAAHVQGWIDANHKPVRKLAARALAGRGLVTVDDKSRPTLTEPGAAFGAELREGYREILRGELDAPPAETVWLITLDHAEIKPAVFAEGSDRPVMHGGFTQRTPRWHTLTDAAGTVDALFASLGYVPPYEGV